MLEIEYAPKGTLRRCLEDRHSSRDPLDAVIAFGWVRQICSALHAMHEPDPMHDRPWSLTHGDLKPENVLIGSDGAAKIFDPGMVRIWARLSASPDLQIPEWENSRLQDRLLQCQPFRQLSEDRGIGIIGPVAGTPPYMAPEQWMGIDAVEPATDIYALGIVVFELFSGVKGWPHMPSRHDVTGWHNAHLSGAARNLRDVEGSALSVGPLGHLPKPEYRQYASQALAALNDLVARCIAPRPEARPTAKEAFEQLSEAATKVGISTYDRGNVPETRENAATYWCNLGMSYCNVGQDDHGSRLLQKGLDIDPDNPERWLELGKARLTIDQAEEALLAFLSAEKYLTQHGVASHEYLLTELQWNTGKALLDLERYSEAITRFQGSLAVLPDQADVWAYMGLAYGLWSMGTPSDSEAYERIEMAKRCCEQSLQIDASGDMARAILTMIESGTGEISQGFQGFV